MSAKKINKIINRIEDGITDLDVGIKEAQDTNTKKREVIENLKVKLNEIITKITTWYNNKIKIHEDIIAENEVAIEKATNLKSNIEKLFVNTDTTIQPKDEWPHE